MQKCGREEGEPALLQLQSSVRFSNRFGFCDKALVAGGSRSGVCEKVPEASPVSDRANASQLQDRAAAGQG